MKEIQLQTRYDSSRILIGETLDNVTRYIPAARTCIITDENVFRHYGRNFPDGLVIRLQPGETSKTLDVVSGIYGELIRNEYDRTSFILGIGGGVVCDIAGFVASTYLRGVAFGFVATTLLAQVDAGIGGKNGVNFEGFKNMIGVIRQPGFVICDPDLLKTLEPSIYRQGFAEVVKYASIFDAPFFEYLESFFSEALGGDPQVLERILFDCARAKTEIVARDELESGERKKLNFGHTFGHAFEKLYGIPHGEAVSIGMIIAAGISAKLGLLPAADRDRIASLLEDFMLPASHPGMGRQVFETMKKDKKRGGEKISLVLLESLGHAVLRDVSLENLKDWIHDLR